ncbi:MAG: hypothetical protein RQ826_11330 [Xanthomonadales bacterium]|nr:hypothetical protein [Xanthomonadales bacterium]
MSEGKFIKEWGSRLLPGRLLAVALAVALAATTPTAAFAQSLDEAARNAARQYNAKVLSARTVQDGQRRVHVIKLLTKDGVVITVRVPVRKR